MDELKKIIENKGGIFIEGQFILKESMITIICSNNHEWRTTIQYILDNGWCYNCSLEINKTKKIIKPFKKLTISHQKRSITMAKRKEEVRKNITEKFCEKCKETKNLSEFNKRGTGVTGYQSYCKDCVNIAKKEHREKVKNEKATFDCTHCSKTYELKDSLTRHMKEKHLILNI
jgi:hypothetical protein